MNKNYSKTIGLCLISTLVFVAFFGMTSKKIFAEESTNITTKTLDTTSADKIIPDTKKPSPYSLIKERIQELQQKMKVNNEQKKELSTTTKNFSTTTKEMNARKQPLINAVKNNLSTSTEKGAKNIGEEKREEIRQKLTENSIKRINAYTEKIVNRFNAALERFVLLSDRAEARIKKIEDSGILLKNSKTLLQKTRDEISLAKIKVGEISLKIEEIIASENPKEMFKSSKDVFNATNESIKVVHKSLVELIKSIKNTVEKNGDTTKLED